MSDFVTIQKYIECEPCKECGARPVIEQKKWRYIVRCPNNSKHYQTAPGLIDIDDWNRKNKVTVPLGTEAPVMKAS